MQMNSQPAERTSQRRYVVTIGLARADSSKRARLSEHAADIGLGKSHAWTLLSGSQRNHRHRSRRRRPGPLREATSPARARRRAWIVRRVEHPRRLDEGTTLSEL